MFEKLATTSNRQHCNYFEGPISNLYDIYSPAIHSDELTGIFMASSISDSSLWSMKVINITDDRNQSLILEELKLQSKFAKLGIAPKALDIIETEDKYFIPSELMDGCSLREQLNKDRKSVV